VPTRVPLKICAGQARPAAARAVALSSHCTAGMRIHIVVLALLAATGSSLATSRERPETEYAAVQPPPPKLERPRGKAPSAAFVWVPGHWSWREPRFVWVKGYWGVPPRAGWIRENARWVAENGQFTLQPGRWRPAVIVPLTVYTPPPPPQTPLIVAVEPPPPLIETRPEPAAADAVWIPGSWHWNGAKYLWSAGRWSAARPGWMWSPPQWLHRDDGRWQWMPGLWHRT
jgi:hypothetical protein